MCHRDKEPFTKKEFIVPVVVRHNGMIYEKSLQLLHDLLPELTTEYLYRHSSIATVRFEAEAINGVTRKMKEQINNGDLRRSHNVDGEFPARQKYLS